MSTRLTKDIRESIAKALVVHRFTAQITKLYADNAALALAVYNDAYSKADREKMMALPNGWLPEVDTISAYFGTSYTTVNVNGKVYGDLARIVSADKNAATFRVQSRHKGACLKKYDAIHKFSAEYDRLQGVKSDLTTAVDTARRSALAAMAAVGTVKRLIEVWPEIAPFASKFEGERPQLPALQTDKLNELLDLPVAEAA